MNYYYSDGAEVQGPYTLSDLSKYFSTGALPAATPVCVEGTEDWQTLSSLFQPAAKSDTQPIRIRQPAAKSDTKACPMCGEQILPAAKKCKHCGEYLDTGSRPRKSSQEPDFAVLQLQTKMKSVGVAAVLSIFIWPFGCAYSSLGSFAAGLVASFIAAIVVFIGLHQEDSPVYVLGTAVIMLPVYIVTIITSIRAVSKFNNRMIEYARRNG